MTNINKRVWDYIDARIEIRKAMARGLINASALAREIASREGMNESMDAIISAIRRYDSKEKESHYKSIYDLLKKSKISSKTKLASILVRRNDETQKIARTLYSKVRLTRSSTLKILDVTNHIKINMDEELLPEIKSLFSDHDVEEVQKNLGEVVIAYADDITKIPGVFATLSNELAMNGISIIDSMICHREHFFVVRENDLEKAFGVVFSLTKSG